MLKIFITPSKFKEGQLFSDQDIKSFYLNLMYYGINPQDIFILGSPSRDEEVSTVGWRKVQNTLTEDSLIITIPKTSLIPLIIKEYRSSSNTFIVTPNGLEDVQLCKIELDNSEILINSSSKEAVATDLINLRKILNDPTDLGKEGFDVIGGSFAELSIQKVVIKKAESNGKDKLDDEINWLLNLPKATKDKFPQVLYHKIEQNYSEFCMPYYDMPNIRKLIMTGEWKAENTIPYLQKIFSFLFQNIYSVKLNTSPPQSWVNKNHIDRVLTRLNICSQQSPRLKALIELPSIDINNIKYKNLPHLLDVISADKGLLKKVQPKELSLTHGDLHLQNILINIEKEDFLLADPRGGKEGADIFYDLGKIWHSLNGLYDFLHTDQFTITKSNNSFTFDLHNNYAKREYSRLKEILPEILNEFIDFESDLIKIEFNEAMHFSSVMMFHLGKDSTHSRSEAMYLTAVILLNKFVQKYCN